MIARIAIAALLATPCALAAAVPKAPSNPIVGGKDAAHHDWLAMIRMNGSPTANCGGTIIAENILLTAGHCSVDESGKPSNPDGMLVSAVRYDQSKSTAEEGGIDYDVTKIIPHPEFTQNPVPLNDLAIWVLKRKTAGGKTQPTASLSTDATTPASLIVSGWGTLSSGGEQPDILQEVSVPIMDQKKCQQYLGGAENAPDSTICAGKDEGGVDSCQGDSGGPLFSTNAGQATLYGIVSWGNGCAAAKQPGVYTRVSSFADWIKEQIAANSGGAH
ncbi:uncharacterized protein EV422DRAFT_123891 [Fimicolochytrium jonesii]|uniref:uncharacterized protein n=1 Tax=Fimicolochytrium jonesii TaxID=1396493 RepID=UPI0022FDFCCD|nr:uncharacterized protein EV422DRAFT_123891 [Fimicolochytrium jonesii]KAI8818884.1 hypothetical protein EV422DRAFT_123891 [Fimicolochytrium jonesii]